MKYPVVIVTMDSKEVDFYGSTEAAAMTMEAVDVRAGLYRGYDAEGRLLDIDARSERGHWWCFPRDVVRISEGGMNEVGAEELQGYIRGCFKSLNETGRFSIGLEGAEGLGDLIRVAYEQGLVRDVEDFTWG